MHPASRLRSPTGRSSRAIFPTRPSWPRIPREAPPSVHVSAESFSLSRWSAREGSGRATPRNILAALSVVHGMDVQCHLVARLYSTGTPADSRQIFRTGHFAAPLVFSAAIVFHHHLNECVRIGPAEILDGTLDRNHLRLVEHGKRMVRKRRTCCQHCRNGDEAIAQHPTHLALHRSRAPPLPLQKARKRCLAGKKKHPCRDYTREALSVHVADPFRGEAFRLRPVS